MAIAGVRAFDASEISTLVEWVRQGGALLLIADHMPFAGAVASLAAPFGIQFANGYALLGDADPRTGDYPITFRRRDTSLAEHPITAGKSIGERIDSIVSFTGSAFRLTAANGRALMTLPKGTRLELPIVAWQFSDTTPRISGEGWLQGGTVTFGRGRIAVFGEAAMFSAQRKGPQHTPMGMNAPEAAQNPAVRAQRAALAGGPTLERYRLYCRGFSAGVSRANRFRASATRGCSSGSAFFQRSMNA